MSDQDFSAEQSQKGGGANSVAYRNIHVTPDIPRSRPHQQLISTILKNHANNVQNWSIQLGFSRISILVIFLMLAGVAFVPARSQLGVQGVVSSSTVVGVWSSA